MPPGSVHTELFHADPVPRAPVAALAGSADGRRARHDPARRPRLRLRPAPRRRRRAGGRAAGALGPAVRLQGRRLRHLPRPAGRGHRRDGRQLRARARRDRARLRAHLPVAPDRRAGRRSTTTPEASAVADLHDDEIPIDLALVRALVDRAFPQYADEELRPLGASGLVERPVPTGGRAAGAAPAPAGRHGEHREGGPVAARRRAPAPGARPAGGGGGRARPRLPRALVGDDVAGGPAADGGDRGVRTATVVRWPPTSPTWSPGSGSSRSRPEPPRTPPCAGTAGSPCPSTTPTSGRASLRAAGIPGPRPGPRRPRSGSGTPRSPRRHLCRSPGGSTVTCARRTSWSATGVWPGRSTSGASPSATRTVDLVVAWEVLDAAGRDTFREALAVDDGTWLRARVGGVPHDDDLPLLPAHDAGPMRRPAGDGSGGARDGPRSSPAALRSLHEDSQPRRQWTEDLGDRVRQLDHPRHRSRRTPPPRASAALDEGITTFDTADVYAGTRAEAVLGGALKGERREGLEIFTKVYWPTGPGAHNDRGLSRKHIMESINGSLTPAADRLRRPLPGAPLRLRRPRSRRRWRRSPTSYARARRSTSGCPSGAPRRSGPAHALARELRIPLVSNQPQYSMLWRVIEAEVVPTCEELGIGQIVWSPIAQGVLTGKYLPGQPPPAGSRATDDKGGADLIERWLQRRRARAGPAAQAARRGGRADHWPSSPSPGCCRTPTSRPRSSAPAGPSRSPTTSRPSGVALDAGDAEGDRRGRRAGRRARPRQDPVAAAPGLLMQRVG